MHDGCLQYPKTKYFFSFNVSYVTYYIYTYFLCEQCSTNGFSNEFFLQILYLNIEKKMETRAFKRMNFFVFAKKFSFLEMFRKNWRGS